MKKTWKFIIVLPILLSMACAVLTGSPTAAPDMAATMDLALEQTLTAQPTATASRTPSPTPTATFTPEPTSTSTETPTPTEAAGGTFSVEILENGWSQYTYPAEGFRVAIPSDWKHLDLSADDLDQMLDSLAEGNSQFSELFSSSYCRQMAAAGIKFYALDSSVASLSAGVQTSFNILVSEMPFDLSLDDLAEINVQQLGMMFGESIDVQDERIEINGIEAGKFTYEVEVENIFGKMNNVVFNQIFMIEDGVTYVLTFGAASTLAEENEAIFAEIADSFEFIP